MPSGIYKWLTPHLRMLAPQTGNKPTVSINERLDFHFRT
jgi:hypothetical protein